MKPRARTNNAGLEAERLIERSRTGGVAAVDVHSLRSFAADVLSRVAAGQDLEPRRALPNEIVEQFCDALIADDSSVSEAFVTELRAAGMSPDLLCLDVLGPAARLLGERWDNDTATFYEVSLGSGRLHALLRQVQRDFDEQLGAAAPRLRALFAAVPGESHVLGITMAAGFFRRAGWTVDLMTSTDLRTLTDHARIGGYQLIGLSGGSRRAQDAIVKSVRILRDVAPSAAIAIGGEVTKLCPNMLNESGADLICGDVARDALAFRKAVLSRTGAPTGRK